MKRLLSLCVLLTVLMFGCGSGEGTSGTLTMSDIVATDLTGGKYGVSATATYTPENGKSPNGVVIHFTAVYSTATNSESRSLDSTLGSSGIAEYTNYQIVQGSEPIYLRLTSSYAGLSQVKTVTIPALAQ